MIVVIHGGQTGVDRGAHKAAVDVGFRVAGFMPRDQCDENGAIPIDVAAHLEAHRAHGYGQRTVANVARARALLCIVKDKHNPYATPGTRLTLHTARRRNIPSLTFDAGVSSDDVFAWLLSKVDLECEPQIMVGGPRASKWPAGEAVAYGFVVELAAHLRARMTPR